MSENVSKDICDIRHKMLEKKMDEAVAEIKAMRREKSIALKAIIGALATTLVGSWGWIWSYFHSQAKP